jgi:hypothetical protein
MRVVTSYTDVLSPRTALYLVPDMPDEFGGKARKLEELTRTASEISSEA